MALGRFGSRFRAPISPTSSVNLTNWYVLMSYEFREFEGTTMGVFLYMNHTLIDENFNVFTDFVKLAKIRISHVRSMSLRPLTSSIFRSLPLLCTSYSIICNIDFLESYITSCKSIFLLIIYLMETLFLLVNIDIFCLIIYMLWRKRSFVSLKRQFFILSKGRMINHSLAN